MKKAFCVFLLFALILGLSACTKTDGVNAVVAEANEKIAACQPKLEGMPLVLSGSFDKDAKSYTLTLAISSEKEYKDYIYSVHYKNLVANGFNSLSSVQKEAVLAQLMAQQDKYGSAEAAIISLVKKELPMDKFDEFGIKLVVVYQNRNGSKTVVE